MRGRTVQAFSHVITIIPICVYPLYQIVKSQVQGPNAGTVNRKNVYTRLTHSLDSHLLGGRFAPHAVSVYGRTHVLIHSPLDSIFNFAICQMLSSGCFKVTT